MLSFFQNMTSDRPPFSTMRILSYTIQDEFKMNYKDLIRLKQADFINRPILFYQMNYKDLIRLKQADFINRPILFYQIKVFYNNFPS